jgi:23S rRNA (cytosine1962-C5)-methyltransferase
MADSKFEMFANRLQKLYRHRSKIAARLGIFCYRLYDRDLPEFPLIIEIYGLNVYVAEYRSQHKLSDEAYQQWLELSLATVKEILGREDDQVWCKERRRKTDRQGQYQKTGNEHREFVIEEGGLKFLINLGDYLDTGLFLDHRITRDMVRKNSNGKKVLNLFCYTGSFTVYAASGGASETVSVDMSNTYIAWADRNMQLNGFAGSHHRLIRGDVLQELPLMADDYFDIIILDPPSFSNSKMMKDYLDIQQDHPDLINLCLKKLKKGGLLYFSTNLRNFRLEKEMISAETIKDITKATTPFDFENKLLRWCYLITR